MTREEKDLLLRDLCCRLPYGVKMLNTEPYSDNHNPILTLSYISEDNAIGCRVGKVFMTTSLDSIKPYLFPLSGMAEEQENEWYQLHVQPLFDRLGVSNRKEDLLLQAKSLYIGTDWLNKNHFDYRGLIPMGLANDATGLNIY